MTNGKEGEEVLCVLFVALYVLQCHKLQKLWYNWEYYTSLE
jgi:hypothetical protein